MRTGFIHLCCMFAFVARLAPAHAADLALPLDSATGSYRATLHLNERTVPLSRMHDWTLELHSNTGDAFIPTLLRIDGGMTAHGHGLPSEPQFTKYLGDGRFSLEGVLFNMAGGWQLRVLVDGPFGRDTLTGQVDVRAPEIRPDGGAAAIWSPGELGLMRSLHISAITAPTDPTNRLIGVSEAIELGAALFGDTGLSGTGTVSCATCHQKERYFTDGRKTSRGSKDLTRNAPSVVGAAHSQWFYWDGRRDSLWAQALTPIESPGEMDNTRTDAVRYVLDVPRYRQLLRAVTDVPLPVAFEPGTYPRGAGPYAGSDGKSAWSTMAPADQETVNRTFALIGKAIAAYLWTLDYEPAAFDAYVDAAEGGKPVDGFSNLAERGLKLFLQSEKTHCLRCHNGPTLSNGGFHNVGSGPDAAGGFDYGRMLGAQAVWYDKFNCQGGYSDADPNTCKHLQYGLKRELPQTATGAFKVPSLRNVADTGPYFHDGRFATLEAIIDHYRNPPDRATVLHELPDLVISDDDAAALVEFLRTL